MPSKSERAARERVRDAARAGGRVAQVAFGPDAAQRNLVTAPIYKTPPAADVPAERGLVPARLPETQYGSLPIMPVELIGGPIVGEPGWFVDRDADVCHRCGDRNYDETTLKCLTCSPVAVDTGKGFPITDRRRAE